jgi:uncharacterized protein YjbI with pentapeptide repeats
VVERASRPHLLLEGLAAGEEQDLVLERRHDGVAWESPDLAGERLLDRELVECVLTEARLDDAVLTGTRLRECRLDRCAATTLRADRADWREVEVVDGRFGALDAYDSELRQVAFTGCRLGYVNLRGSRVTDLTLEGCHVDDLDLGDAQVVRLTAVDSTVSRLLLGGSELRDVDLRGLDLSRLDELVGDRFEGITVGADQLVALAPVLASRLGIRIA